MTRLRASDLTPEARRKLGISEQDTEKPNKYGAKGIDVDGMHFDSQVEAQRYGELVYMLHSGEICDLERQVRFELVVRGVVIATYTADHVYRVTATGERVVEEVKSEATARARDWPLKLKLMKACHGIEVRVVRG
jgi:hypothetical protein